MGIEALLSTQIIDTTTVGRAVITAVDAAAARAAIGAGTSSFDGAYSSLTGIPSTFTPSAHKTSHATGGTDALSPSDIGAVPTSRQLTINGTAYDLSADRSWTVSGGISSLNTLTDATQTFQTGTTGTNFAIVSAAGVHTFNLPDASATARGLITTGTQTIAGVKTFSSQIVVTGGTQSAPSLQLAAGTASTIFGPYYNTQNGKGWVFVANSTAAFKLSESAINLATGVPLSWGNAFDGIGPTRIYRDADYEIGLRNGVNPHTFRVYNTYTSTTSYVRLSIGWSGNIGVLDTEQGSAGGATGGLRIGGTSASLIGLWGATPIARPTTGVTGATRVGGGGTTLTDTDTFDGYTLAQIVKALRNIGALA